MQKPVKVLGKTIVPGPAKTSADKQCVHSILGMDARRAIPPEKVGIGQFFGYSVNSPAGNLCSFGNKLAKLGNAIAISNLKLSITDPLTH